jgi:hypothetical protein
VVEGNSLTVERQLESLILDEVWELLRVDHEGAFVGSDGESFLQGYDVSLHPDDKASNIVVDGEGEQIIGEKSAMNLVVRVDYQLVDVVDVD